MTQHPNAEILRAIADGKTVQWSTGAFGSCWHDWESASAAPSPTSSIGLEWRIKPEPEPLFERWHFVQRGDDGVRCNTVFFRTSLEEAVKTYNGAYSDSGRRSFVGFLCMTTDEHTVRKVEFFSKAELKAKGLL